MQVLYSTCSTCTMLSVAARYPSPLPQPWCLCFISAVCMYIVLCMLLSCVRQSCVSQPYTSSHQLHIYTYVLVLLICTYVCMLETPAALWALMLSDLPPWSMCRCMQEACHSQVPLQKAKEGQHTLWLANIAMHTVKFSVHTYVCLFILVHMSCFCVASLSSLLRVPLCNFCSQCRK